MQNPVLKREYLLKIWGIYIYNKKVKKKTLKKSNQTKIRGGNIISQIQFLYEGNQNLDNSNYKGALSNFNKALEIDPNDSLTWFLLNRSFEGIGDYENESKGSFD